MQPRGRLLLLAAVSVGAAMIFSGVAAAGERSAENGSREPAPAIIIRSLPEPPLEERPTAVPSPGYRWARDVQGSWVVTRTGRFQTVAEGEIEVVAEVVEEAAPERSAVDAIFPLAGLIEDLTPSSLEPATGGNSNRSADVPVDPEEAAVKLAPAETKPATAKQSTKAKAGRKTTPRRVTAANRGTASKAGKAQPPRSAKASQPRPAQVRKATARGKQTLRAKAARRRALIPAPEVRQVPVVTVRGITVHRRIAGRTEALLRAADRAKLRLGGWGYRSTRRQIQLRRDHCGGSRYALYRMPAGRCWPPTAQPGKSMHERGLAIDFYVKGRKGRTLPIAGTREFRWLQRNAAKYGFYNLPSEAWHWSVNGR